MSPGKVFIVLGVILIMIGICLCYGCRFDWLGRLPGDIRIERENFRVYLPLGTCFLISIVVSLLAWLLKH